MGQIGTLNSGREALNSLGRGVRFLAKKPYRLRGSVFLSGINALPHRNCRGVRLCKVENLHP